MGTPNKAKHEFSNDGLFPAVQQGSVVTSVHNGSSHSKKIFLTALIGTIMASLSANILAQSEPSFWDRPTLTGDWGGNRTMLAERGVDFNIVYTGEFFHNASGGLEQDTEYLDNFDFGVSIDAEKLYGWRGASFYFYGLGNHGGSPSENSGDFQGVSNIDSPNAFKLYEAWYQQKFYDNQMSLLFGLYDLNSEFDSIETASLFINPSHGIGPDFSQTGLNGPSIFPTTALALRFKYEPAEWLYLQAAVFDGVPGDLSSEQGTHVRFDNGDGVLQTAEIGFFPGAGREDDPYSKVAFGVWRYTADFEDLVRVDPFGDPRLSDDNRGFYLLGEYAVYREEGDEEQGLRIYGRVGYANEDLNPLDHYVGMGLVYTGPFESRDSDQLGLAIAHAVGGRPLREYFAGLGTSLERAETNVELSYRAQVTPWLALQPDVQYIVNPSFDPSTDNALQVGLRFEVVF